jgi:hypothetical protein
MADEIPPAPSESEDASKAETIRITLPPRQEQQAIKRETVRISLPGKPSSIPPAGIAPKKESTKLGPKKDPAFSETARISPEGDTDASATVARPFSAPTPPSAPAIPPAKPLPGMAPPKPPSFGARPTVPLKPAPAPSAPAPPAPLTQKAAAPKKETARITLPPEGSATKPALPKATVKMQQTQPLVNRPAPTLTPATAITTTALSGHGAPAEADSTANMLSIVALVVAIISLGLVFMAYSAATPQ